MWSVMEPTHYDDYTHLSTTGLNNIKKVLTEANKYGINVNLDFWTQFTYALGRPSWVSDYYNIVDSSDIKAHYIRYMLAVVNELKGYPALESYTVLNEPFYSTSSYKALFQSFFTESYQALKDADPSNIVTCRFTLSYTPSSGKYDKSVYSIFDVFAITEYLDPGNPSDTRYNSKWSYWDTTVADLKTQGKRLWVIEFGASSDWATESQIATRYALSLDKFASSGVCDRAYAWAWQKINGSGEKFNIYDGSSPRPAYFELASV
jgi:endo-1,4-beta-mannosidase